MNGRQELIERISELINNEELYARLSANAREMFKTSFTSERVIADVQQIINSI